MKEVLTLKKQIAFLLSAALLCSSVPAYATDIQVIVDGTSITSDVPAQSINGYTMVPLRAICDALDAETVWEKETGKITITKDGLTNSLKVGDRYAYVTKDGKTEKILIPIAPVVKDGRTLVPVRFVSETLDTEVVWENSTKTVQIRSQADIAKPFAEMDTFTLKTKWHTFATGESVDTLVKKIGRPDRIEKSIGGLNWYVYNDDYEEFLMVAVENNTVCGFYTNTPEFSVNDKVIAGQTYDAYIENMTIYRDKLNNNKVYAVLVYPQTYTSEQAKAYEKTDEYLKTQARLNADCVNSFRVANGLKPLAWDDLLAETARLHSVDMASQDYFDHISPDGAQPHERYYANGGTSYRSYGENIIAGRNTGVDTFDGWLNSDGHRKNMLSEQFTTIGVGGGYDADSTYGYYFAQNFKN